MNSLKFKSIMKDKSGTADVIFAKDPMYIY